jgi:YD repeat-containing protein
VQTAFGYGYDEAGNRKWKAFADGTRETYGYDGLSRLTSVEYPSGRQVEYGYDEVGTRVSLLDGSKTVTRWAATATASTQYSTTSGAAKGAIGPPDAAGCERNATTKTWWPKVAAQAEWLEVGFAGAEQAKGVRIREENSVAPFVMRVRLIRFGGQLDYAAFLTVNASSNSAGLT